MKRDHIYLQHILDAIQKIISYSAVGLDIYLDEPHWQDAIIRQLEIIGEATKNLSQPLRDQYPEIPWKRIAGLRDVLIHDYMGVDITAVWQVTQTEIPKLMSQIQLILKK